MKRSCVAVVVVCLSGTTLPADVVTYPGPDGIAASDQYRVEVTQDSRTHESFVYLTAAQWRSNRAKTTSWTTFSFSDRITVKVTKLKGTFSRCRVLSSSRGIQAHVAGNTASFELRRPAKLAVEFDAIHGGSGHTHDYLFEDVRIENADWRLVHLRTMPNEFARHARSRGKISHLVFRNITADGPMRRPSVIQGWDADHRVSDVIFENVKVAGTYLRDAESANFQNDPATTRNIQFSVTAPRNHGSLTHDRANRT